MRKSVVNSLYWVNQVQSRKGWIFLTDSFKESVRRSRSSWIKLLEMCCMFIGRNVCFLFIAVVLFFLHPVILSLDCIQVANTVVKYNSFCRGAVDSASPLESCAPLCCVCFRTRVKTGLVAFQIKSQESWKNGTKCSPFNHLHSRRALCGSSDSSRLEQVHWISTAPSATAIKTQSPLCREKTTPDEKESEALWRSRWKDVLGTQSFLFIHIAL